MTTNSPKIPNFTTTTNKMLRNQIDILNSWQHCGSKITVSICCLAYNHEDFIEDTILGFLDQKTSFRFEILINDDASLDSTAEIIRKYTRLFPDIIKPIFQTKNKWSQDHLMHDMLFQKAKGKYIAWTDGDDFWINENKLENQIALMEQESDLALSFHPVYYKVGSTLKKDYFPKPKSKVLNQNDIMLKHYIPTCSVVFNTKKLLKAYYEKPCTSTFPVGDIPLYIKITNYGKVLFIDEIWAVYRRNPKSVTQKVEHLHNIRLKMVAMYFHLFTCVPYKNYKIIIYLITRQLAGIPLDAFRRLKIKLKVK